MGKLGTLEIVLIVVAVILIFGAGKLPQLGRAVGDTIREFKKSVKSVNEEETDETKSPEKK